MTRVLQHLALFSSTLAVTVTLLPLSTAPAVAAPARGTYENPLAPRIPGDGTVDSCADPTVLRGRGKYADTWYMYCTTDPLNDAETAGDGPTPFHPVPMMRSKNLVDWTYVGDALEEKPSWAAEGASVWAPDVVFSRETRRYYMTFVVTDTTEAVSGEPGCTSDSAIGVATSRTPVGPWKTSDTPVVAPRRDQAGCSFFWTFDPDVLGNSIGTRGVFYYGSYYGGMYGARIALTREGMQTTSPGKQVTIGNRYEGANVVKRRGWYYLFGSASNCCNGPLTGYSVFSGRSRDPLGPFVDREGNSLLAGRVGGTPVISMNGNRWVGAGHNSVFRDFDGQWWTVYHAADRTDPYFADEPGFTKRPALLDPLDWIDGWPTVRAGRWASDRPVPVPAAQPGERTAYSPHPARPQRLGKRLTEFSDEFDGETISDRWTWVDAPPEAGTYGVSGGRFRFDTQDADLFVDNNSASVLTRKAPKRDYVVQTKLSFDVPAEGCCFNFEQAGLLIYGSDDAFLKLAHVSIFETRQTEFAKEVPSAPAGTPRYGNTVVGPPGDETWLRIVKETSGGRQLFTAYTRQDDNPWIRGGTWTHDSLGDDVRIGLVSMGGPGSFTAKFDHVRAWALKR